MSASLPELSISETDTSLTISVPVQQNQPAMVANTVVVVLGGALLACELCAGLNAWPVILFGGVIVAFALVNLTWQQSGYEVLKVTATGIALSHEMLGHAYTQRFQMEAMSDVFISGDPYPWFYHRTGAAFFDFGAGWVAFNSGHIRFGAVRTWHYGTVLTREGAELVVGRIHQRFPQYCQDTPKPKRLNTAPGPVT